MSEEPQKYFHSFALLSWTQFQSLRKSQKCLCPLCSGQFLPGFEKPFSKAASLALIDGHRQCCLANRSSLCIRPFSKLWEKHLRLQKKLKAVEFLRYLIVNLQLSWEDVCTAIPYLLNMAKVFTKILELTTALCGLSHTHQKYYMMQSTV